MDVRRVVLGGAVVLLVLGLIGGAYALGRSDSDSSPGEPVAQAPATPTVPRPTPTAIARAPTATNQPEPSPTSAGAALLTATAATPTNTVSAPSLPTSTPALPTATSVPPTPAAVRQVLVEGVGNDELVVGPGPLLLRITGNADSRHFAVEAKDAFGESTGLLVNTTEPYQGIVPVGFDPIYGATQRVVITAIGFWTVEVLPVSAARIATAPGFVTGVGDDVLMVTGTPGIAQIIANKDSRHFAIVAYGNSIDYLDLLVNTTEPYDHRIPFPPDTTFLQIDAVGRWTIRFE